MPVRRAEKGRAKAPPFWVTNRACSESEAAANAPESRRSEAGLHRAAAAKDEAGCCHLVGHIVDEALDLDVLVERPGQPQIDLGERRLALKDRVERLPEERSGEGNDGEGCELADAAQIDVVRGIDRPGILRRVRNPVARKVAAERGGRLSGSARAADQTAVITRREDAALAGRSNLHQI